MGHAMKVGIVVLGDVDVVIVWDADAFHAKITALRFYQEYKATPLNMVDYLCSKNLKN